MSLLLTVLLYSGIRLSSAYPLHVLFSLLALILLCSFIFWINLKHDYMSDLMNITSSTVAFDFRFSRSKGVELFYRILKGANPFIGALGTISGILVVLWIIPALIIALISSPDSLERNIIITVFTLDTVLSIAYMLTNRDEFHGAAHKILFLAGVLIGTLTAYQIYLTLDP